MVYISHRGCHVFYVLYVLVVSAPPLIYILLFSFLSSFFFLARSKVYSICGISVCSHGLNTEHRDSTSVSDTVQTSLVAKAGL